MKRPTHVSGKAVRLIRLVAALLVLSCTTNEPAPATLTAFDPGRPSAGAPDGIGSGSDDSAPADGAATDATDEDAGSADVSAPDDAVVDVDVQLGDAAETTSDVVAPDDAPEPLDTLVPVDAVGPIDAFVPADAGPTCDPKDPTSQPGAVELCDGVDNNCNGKTDEGLCDDGNACTSDQCNPTGGCAHLNIDALCDDGTVCTTTDLCKSGVCKGFNAVDCDDQNECTTDTCDPTGGCLHAIASGPCEDGNPCTEGDHCAQGACQGGTLKWCSDGDPCTTDGVCSPTTGCTFLPITTPTDCTYKNGVCGEGQCELGVCVPKDGGSCTTGNSKCPAGTCSNAICFLNAGQTCSAQSSVDLCTPVSPTGACDSAGKCVVSKAPPENVCPGCAGVCVQCFFQVCVPFSTFY